MRSDTAPTPARLGTSRVAAECWKTTPSTVRSRPCDLSRRTLAVHTPKSASPAGCRLGRVHVRPAFANLCLEPGVAVKALFKRRVISGELKLVFPFELQRDFLDPEGWRRSEQTDARREHDAPFRASSQLHATLCPHVKIVPIGERVLASLLGGLPQSDVYLQVPKMGRIEQLSKGFAASAQQLRHHGAVLRRYEPSDRADENHQHSTDKSNSHDLSIGRIFVRCQSTHVLVRILFRPR